MRGRSAASRGSGEPPEVSGSVDSSRAAQRLRNVNVNPFGGDFGGDKFTNSKLGEDRACGVVGLARARRCSGRELEVDGASVVRGLVVFVVGSAPATRQRFVVGFLDAF